MTKKKQLLLRSVHSFSGGVGKTTLAASMACYYARKRNKATNENEYDVVVIDTDISGVGYSATLYKDDEIAIDEACKTKLTFWDIASSYDKLFILDTFNKKYSVCDTVSKKQKEPWDCLKDDVLHEINFKVYDENVEFSHLLLPARLTNEMPIGMREILHSNLFLGSAITGLARLVNSLAYAWINSSTSKNKKGIVFIFDCAPFMTGLGEEVLLWIVWLKLLNIWLVKGVDKLREDELKNSSIAQGKQDNYEEKKKIIENACSHFDDKAFFKGRPFADSELNNQFRMDSMVYVAINADGTTGYPKDWTDVAPNRTWDDLKHPFNAATSYLIKLFRLRFGIKKPCSIEKHYRECIRFVFNRYSESLVGSGVFSGLEANVPFICIRELTRLNSRPEIMALNLIVDQKSHPPIGINNWITLLTDLVNSENIVNDDNDVIHQRLERIQNSIHKITEQQESLTRDTVKQHLNALVRIELCFNDIFSLLNDKSWIKIVRTGIEYELVSLCEFWMDYWKSLETPAPMEHVPNPGQADKWTKDKLVFWGKLVYAQGCWEMADLFDKLFIDKVLL